MSETTPDQGAAEPFEPDISIQAHTAGVLATEADKIAQENPAALSLIDLMIRGFFGNPAKGLGMFVPGYEGLNAGIDPNARAQNLQNAYTAARQAYKPELHGGQDFNDYFIYLLDVAMLPPNGKAVHRDSFRDSMIEMAQNRDADKFGHHAAIAMANISRQFEQPSGTDTRGRLDPGLTDFSVTDGGLAFDSKAIEQVWKDLNTDERGDYHEVKREALAFADDSGATYVGAMERHSGIFQITKITDEQMQRLKEFAALTKTPEGMSADGYYTPKAKEMMAAMKDPSNPAYIPAMAMVFPAGFDKMSGNRSFAQYADYLTTGQVRRLNEQSVAYANDVAASRPPENPPEVLAQPSPSSSSTHFREATQRPPVRPTQSESYLDVKEARSLAGQCLNYPLILDGRDSAAMDFMRNHPPGSLKIQHGGYPLNGFDTSGVMDNNGPFAALYDRSSDTVKVTNIPPELTDPSRNHDLNRFMNMYVASGDFDKAIAATRDLVPGGPSPYS